jgi:excisionase family DNA binding protein
MMCMNASSDDMKPLYVRLPSATAQQLEAAAAARGASKRQIVTDLIGQGLLGGASTMEYGHASVISSARPADSEILTLEEAADLLRVDADELRALAESGQLPARRIGTDWRLSRSALLGWLGAESSGAPRSASDAMPRRGGAIGFASGAAAAEAPAPPPSSSTDERKRT